jgi:hypothetical protein
MLQVVASLAQEAADRVRRARIQVEAGLTDAEFARIEEDFGFRFGPEHREFLSLGLPVGDGWVDWRSGSREDIESRLAGPTDGVVFDVHNNGFWADSWGPKPPTESMAEAVARARMADVPKLIPIYSHRYLPAAPTPSCSPVFSVSQTDVIYYGDNLLDYVAHEFNLPPRHPVADPPHIAFWYELVMGT